MYKEFNKLSRLVQLILLLIPFVGWITEIVVRWSKFLDKKDGMSLLCGILAFIPVFNFLDFFWVLLFHHLILAD